MSAGQQITPDVETVVTVVKSATDKILELPIESVVLIAGWVDSTYNRHRTPVVLHRTGSDGWLPTRYAELFRKRTGSMYVSNDSVREALEQAEANGATFVLLISGNEVGVSW